MSIEHFKPKADYLALSYSTSQSPAHELLGFIHSIEPLQSTDIGGGKTSYTSDYGGSVFVTSKQSFENISISGSVLEKVRDSGRLLEFQQILSSAPSNITRLDIAYDVPISGAVIIRQLKDKFPDRVIRLANRNRKMLFQLGFNGTHETGTCYLQNNKYKGTVKYRIYDKQFQMEEEFGKILPPLTRYELTVHRGCSLNDVFNPSAVFWHFTPENLLKPPKNVPKWLAVERINYEDNLESLTTDYEKFKFMVEKSPALHSLINKANQTNGGKALLLNFLQSKLLDAKHIESKANVAH